MSKIKLAIVGASGLVGRKVLEILDEEKLPIDEYKLFSSSKSAGKYLPFNKRLYELNELNEHSFDDSFDFAIFSAGTETARKFAPIAKENGCIVIDNSNAFRMDKDVPLIVPEVNKNKIRKNQGIIANPNCSTIQAIVALAPLHKKFKINRIVFSTYQAVSGAGKFGIMDYENGNENNYILQKFNHPIINNCLPQIDIFEKDGYTREEHKMINETRKILNDKKIKITATAVRVPVLNCHSESINVEFKEKFRMSEIYKILEKAEGITVIDDIKNEKYPLAREVSGKNKVYVGRIRRDNSIENGINLWVVADNIRKGAAYNAIQILKELI